MTTKQRLLQELETTSETLIEEVLDFLLFIKSRHEESEMTETQSTVSISLFFDNVSTVYPLIQLLQIFV